MGRWQVEWIDKPGGNFNPFTRIERLGGSNWENTEDRVISNIQRHVDTYYVMYSGYQVELEIGYRGTLPYLKTRGDTILRDNLLSLPNVSRV